MTAAEDPTEPVRPHRRRITAAGLPAPDPGPPVAPITLSLPRRPGTRRPKPRTEPRTDPATEPQIQDHAPATEG